MAISNRDRVGKMFELLAPALDDFIARSVAPKLPRVPRGRRSSR